MRVFCNEQLTPHNQLLMSEAKKWNEFYTTWVHKGHIFSRSKLPNSEPVQILDVKAAQTLGSMLSEDEKAKIRAANQGQRHQRPRGELGTNSVQVSRTTGEKGSIRIPTQSGSRDIRMGGKADCGTSGQVHAMKNR